MRITRNDPTREHLHDFIVVDALTRQDLATFDNQDETSAWLTDHVAHNRGRVLILDVVHPEHCTCDAP